MENINYLINVVVDMPAEYNSIYLTRFDKMWFKNNKPHRINGPAQIGYNSDGVVESEEWFLDGKRHQINGPAVIMYNPDGSISCKRWYVNDIIHRIDGPADVSYINGLIWIEEYHENGEQHRIDGPAWIRYNSDGVVERELWYMNGKLYDIVEMKNHI